MTKESIYKIWAPTEGLWSPWVKPVLFSFMDGPFANTFASEARLDLSWAPAPKETAIVVDLPGAEAVRWGMQFARLGYRPIPLFNALPFPMSNPLSSGPTYKPLPMVDVESILKALYQETSALKRLSLPANAPPAFLLDADRRLARVDPTPGVFDNRSVCFTTDVPSPEFLVAQGIRSALLVQKDPMPGYDLLEVLSKWQLAGINLLRKDPRDAAPVNAWEAKKPSFISSIWHRIGVLFGLRRGELGGFGGIVRPSSG